MRTILTLCSGGNASEKRERATEARDAPPQAAKRETLRGEVGVLHWLSPSHARRKRAWATPRLSGLHRLYGGEAPALERSIARWRVSEGDSHQPPEQRRHVEATQASPTHVPGAWSACRAMKPSVAETASGLACTPASAFNISPSGQASLASRCTTARRPG